MDFSNATWTADDWVAIVDDEESVRQSIARYLRVSGLRAQAFGSAEEFLSYTGTPPSCLVIDVQLGTTTGFELRDCLAARRSVPAPIIFITARDNVAALGPANGKGALTWLRKPFRGQALVELLCRLRAATAK